MVMKFSLNYLGKEITSGQSSTSPILPFWVLSTCTYRRISMIVDYNSNISILCISDNRG